MCSGKRAEVERLPNGAHRAHADAEHQHEHERAAPERNVMPFKLIEDNKQEHSDKNADGNDLSKHVIPPCAMEFPTRVIISTLCAEAKCFLDMADISFCYAAGIFLISCGFAAMFTFRQGSVLFSRIRLAPPRRFCYNQSCRPQGADECFSLPSNFTQSGSSPPRRTPIISFSEELAHEHQLRQLSRLLLRRQIPQLFAGRRGALQQPAQRDTHDPKARIRARLRAVFPLAAGRAPHARGGEALHAHRRRV